MDNVPKVRSAILFLATVGVTIAPASGQPSIEAAFLRVPSAAGARESSKAINQRAHYPGSSGDYQLAVYVRDAMRRFGLRAWIEPFTATVYTPRVLQLQLLAAPVVNFSLRDQRIAADPDGSRSDAGLPFNAGSGDGDVRAPLVYVSRGLEADYATVARAGVAVAGKLVLVRYGAEYRGNLAARAARHGAAGVIFYSDPKDDGFARGSVYPNGPYRPLGVVQRGDVMADDHRQLTIPTLPVTATTAALLLANVRGAAGPTGWAGALPVSYAVGVTQSLVRLHVEMNARSTTLWNTIGELPGSDPSQMVVLGGHRDAWVYGVTDDGSGISTLLEVARGLGAVHRSGWVPKRSIRIAGWDAEEIGELGSSAYVAAHRGELLRGCVAYVNTDESASGPTFGAAGAAALAPVLRAAVGDVLHLSNVGVPAPAGGSDFESFIYTMGTPVLDLGYSGPFGTYHSPFDDLRFASLYADPGFVHHRAIAQTIGVVAIRLASSGAGAFRFEPYVAVLDDGMRDITRTAASVGVTVNPGLSAAVTRFEDAARAYDSNPPTGSGDKALKAVQVLDLVAYSASGYASVAFPRVAAAIASVKQQAVDSAVAATVDDLNQVTAILATINTQ